jgi:hypothetical protein
MYDFSMLQTGALLLCSPMIEICGAVCTEPFCALQVRYIKSKVSKVQPSVDLQEGGIITLADGTALPYDWLVLALGSDTNLGERIPPTVASSLLLCAQTRSAVNPTLHVTVHDQSRHILPYSIRTCELKHL